MDWLTVLPLALMELSASLYRPDAHRPDLALAQFVLPVDGVRSCWKGEFAGDDPEQDVAAMSFGMMYEWQTDGYWEQGRDLFSYELNLSFRDGANGRAVGNCLASPDGPLYCAVECDGGGFDLAKADDGSLTLDFTRFGYIRLRYCGEPVETRKFTPRPDHGSFRLDPVPPDQCPAIHKPDYEAGLD